MKLFLFILAGAILEVFVWIGVGDLVGSMWYVFFWFIAAFFIGMSLIRKYSAGLMPQMQQMQAGQMGADPALTNNLPKIIAGFLLLIPGLVTDVVAVLLLIPAVQKAMTGALMNVMMKRQQAMMEKMMGGMMGDMNGMAGGAFGFLIGCVLCFIVFTAMPLLQSVVPLEQFQTLVDQSALAKVFENGNLIISIMNRRL